MRYLIATLLILFLFIGCKSNQPRIVQDTTIVKDSTSVVTKITPRDTIIPVAKDSISITVPIKEISETPIERTSPSGRSKARVSRTQDDLHIDCVFEELELRMTLFDKQIEVLKLQSKQQNIVTEIDVPYTPWHIKILSWIGIAFIILLAIGGLLKLLKFV